MATPIKTFEQYWEIVTSNDLWYDQIKMRHARKDIRSIAQNAFIDLLTTPQRLAAADPTDFQKHLSKFLMYAKDEVARPQLQQDEVREEPKGPQEPPLTGEAREAKIKEFVALLRQVGKKEKPLIDGQVEELGQTDPPKKKGVITPFDPEKQLQVKKELDERTRKGRELWYRENYPLATDEQVTEYLNSFEDGK